jgi:uncharacterized protein (DUF58 family)
MTVSTERPWRASPAHFRAVAIGAVGIAVALLFRVPMLLVLSAPFVLVSVWSTMTRPERNPTLAGRIGPAAVREGEATTWTGELTDVGGVDHVIAFAPERPWLEAKPSSGVATVAVGHDDPTATVAIPMRATHWGRHDIGPINIVSVASWGAFRWKALDVGYQVTTLPLPDVFDAASPTHRADGLVGLNRSAHPGDGNEFAGIRPFQSGDRLRRINWRRSLRSDELHVTATYADQDSHVALFIDALADFGPSGGIDGPSSSLDTTVRAAGAISEYFLLRGDRVSLRVLDSRFTATVPPASGRSHLRRILDVLATVEPDMYRPVSAQGRAPTMVPNGALAIMLSPLVSPVALQRATSIASRGLGVAVIDTLPDDVHLDDDATTELAWRIRLLERRREVRLVQQVGVPVIAWRGPGSLDPFLREIARRSSAPRMARR